MTTNTKRWNDDRMRDIMGTLLRIGVLLAASLVVIGGILFFIQLIYFFLPPLSFRN